jgi:hypothetical protein
MSVLLSRDRPIVWGALIALVFAAACDGGRDPRPGGGGRRSNNNPPESTDPNEREPEASQDASREPEESRDAGREPDPEDAGRPNEEIADAGFFFFDAEPPFDAGFRDADVPDVGFRDAGFRDATPAPPDASPPDAGRLEQTMVSFVPGTAVIRTDGTDLEFQATLEYDNVGPGSETISVVSAAATYVIGGTMQIFSVGPAHAAPVGLSQRPVEKIPGTGDRALDPLTLQFVCALQLVGVELELSNGLLVTEIATLDCGP